MRTRLGALVPLAAISSLSAQDPDPNSMQYGPFLMTTVECGDAAGTTTKALVVRLGEQGAVAFDTELLRVSAAWTDGWLRLRGTAYDGSHGPMPAVRGRKVFHTKPGPGWAKGGAFVDPRPIPYGPLPREHGFYRGASVHGDQVVVEYRIGDMDVREGYTIENGAVARTLELAPSTAAQDLVVFDAPAGASPGPGIAPRAAGLQWVEPVEIAATATGWDTLPMGGPSRDDYLDAASGTGATIVCVPGFAMPHAVAPKAPATAPANARPLGALADGAAAAGAEDDQACVWFDEHEVAGKKTRDARLLVDLQREVEVRRVNTFTWHGGGGSRQQYDLFGAAGGGAAGDAPPDPAAKDLAAAGWTKIGSVDTRRLDEGDKHAAGIATDRGLGRFRHLLFAVNSGGAHFCEIDVFADRFRAAVDQSNRSARYAVAVLRGDGDAVLDVKDARIVMRVPPHREPLRLQLLHASGTAEYVHELLPRLTVAAAVAPLPAEPGRAHWGEPIVTKGVRGADDGPFAVDTITIPLDNRFHSRMRTGAFDFFSDGRAAVSTWNGDVWVVSGIDEGLDHLEWRRFATGLFDPLGLRIVGDVVFVHGRDGITKLHDDNGDGEADRFECFNNQVYATPAFHEFAFDLQTDAEGNFYFSKGAPVNPGGRGFMKIVPHHGSLLKVSKDGSRIETIATGLRAPNGIGVSPTGVVTSGDNEGTYMPRCRINYIEKPGFYAGVKDTAHRTPVPEQPDLPLCWLPMEVDNSSGGQAWVPEKSGWSDLPGRMLHLSYGTCSVYLVLDERVNGQIQGGVVRLPADFSSSCMRGRFSSKDGQLYVIGLQGWQTSAAREGGFHRVRRTKAPLGLPVALRTCDKGVYVTFAEPLDATTASDAENWGVEIWNYLYSSNYGSPELSLLHPERKVEQGKPNRDPLPIGACKLSPDGRTVFLAIDGMRPVHQMKITWNVDSKDGRALKGELHNSIHALAKDPGFPAER